MTGSWPLRITAADARTANVPEAFPPKTKPGWLASVVTIEPPAMPGTGGNGTTICCVAVISSTRVRSAAAPVADRLDAAAP